MPSPIENIEAQNVTVVNKGGPLVNMANRGEMGGAFPPRECGPMPGSLNFSNPYENMGLGSQVGMQGAELNQMQGEINQMNMSQAGLYGGQDSPLAAPMCNDGQQGAAGSNQQIEQMLGQLLTDIQGGQNGGSGGSSNPLSSILGGLGGDSSGGGSNPLSSILGGLGGDGGSSGGGGGGMLGGILGGLGGDSGSSSGGSSSGSAIGSIVGDVAMACLC